jgi:hypothetical protein
MKVYISGPMTGLPKYNYPAFHAAEKRLHTAGYDVINPARPPAEPMWGWLDFMRRALVDLSEAEAIHLLPGWESSKGARLEAHVADQLDLPVIHFPGIST